MKDKAHNLGGSDRLLPFLSLLFVVTLGTQFMSPRAGAAPNGQQIFKDNCAGCHQDGGNVMEAKKPVKGSSKLATLDKFKDYLAKPSGAMPPQPAIVKDAPTLDALYKYCKTLK